MHDHEHIKQSEAGGGPQPAGNQSTPIITCPQHGTMRTGGTCGQCQPTGSTSTSTRALDREPAGQQITAQTDAGKPTGRIGHVQADIVAHLPSEARTPEGQAFAYEGDTTAETLVHELNELDEPGLTPGAPHPDPYLAARGWHVCNHGIYTRHPDGQLQDEPEAC
jgi:hypothetical protein